MKRFWFILFLFSRAVSSAGDQEELKVPPTPVRLPQAPRAWLGLEVSKPDDSITAHLPDLPTGVGFVIRAIHKGGPADAAGLKEFDVLWKLGDQMLVNEGQLAALLRLSKPGDEVVLCGFRAGKTLEVKLKLGEAPALKRPFPVDFLDEPILPGECRGPMRVVNVSERSARYTTDEGTAEVYMDGQTYKAKIHGPNEEVIFEGYLPADGSLDGIPDDWKRRIHALRRGLDHALDGRLMPQRQPRPRVVPPTEPKP